MPNSMVVDVSFNVGAIDFRKLRDGGVVGVVHRASLGIANNDKNYAPRRKEAEAAGLLWGAYHVATGANVTTQFNHFLKAAAPDAKTMLALEINEALIGNAISLRQVREFLQQIEAELGRAAVVCGGRYLKELLLDRNDSYLGAHRLWWVQYASEVSLQSSWSSYWLWQHSDGYHGPKPHTVAGIVPTYLNTFDGTPRELAAGWAGGPLTAAEKKTLASRAAAQNGETSDRARADGPRL